MEATYGCGERPVGQRYGWHSFRRPFSNRLGRSGALFRDLQDLGGGRIPKTLTEVYLLPDEEAQRRVRSLKIQMVDPGA